MSIGSQDNKIPAKYLRLVRDIYTDRPVGPDYQFPAGLSGDQYWIEVEKKTITDIRLRILELKINADEEPLQGAKTGEFGIEAIYEEIVDEGTKPLVGELIQYSEVTPFGNGKALRATTRYPTNLFTLQKIRKSIGQPESLIPAKYRRLITDIETEKPVPVNYTFPSGLTGDQIFIEFAQKTITEARLRILEQKINTDESPLQGADSDEYGVLIVYEEIVEEGTAVQTGFLIKHSEVTALGNGKAVRITIAYKGGLVAVIKITNAGSGGSNGAHTDGTFNGSGSFNYTVAAGAVVASSIVITDPGSFKTPPKPLFPSAGSNVAATTYLGTVPLVSRLWDEEMLVHYDQTRQIIMAGAPDSPAEDYVKEESKQLDVWRLQRIREKKIPTAVDEATAITSSRSRPYSFPGLFPPAPALFNGTNWVYLPFSYRKTTATLTQARIFTYWVLSTDEPEIAADDIITDSIFVFTADDDKQGEIKSKRFEGVLHDSIFAAFIEGLVTFQFSYPPTTPSYSEYTGSAKMDLTGTIATNGTTAIVGTGTAFTTEVAVGDLLFGVYPVASITNNTHLTLSTAISGTASGLATWVIRPGSGWIGTERKTSVVVTPTGHSRLWKVEIEKIVMR
jgi:hypothetical protein